MLYIKNVIDPKDIGKVLPWVHISYRTDFEHRIYK